MAGMTPEAGISQTPERTHKQRMEALSRANRVRSERARLKENLKKGESKIADVLEEPPAYVHTAKVFDLLMAVPPKHPRSWIHPSSSSLSTELALSEPDWPYSALPSAACAYVPVSGRCQPQESCPPLYRAPSATQLIFQQLQHPRVSSNRMFAFP